MACFPPQGDLGVEKTDETKEKSNVCWARGRDWHTKLLGRRHPIITLPTDPTLYQGTSCA